MKVLFLCEGLTLSHIVRPMLLIKNLKNIETCLASTHFPSFLKSELEPLRLHKLSDGITAEYFNQSLYLGSAVFTEKILEKYIEVDCKIIDEFKPDVVVSDFRVSASISCKIKAVPLITLGNIVWSPYAKQSMLSPENPALRYFGVTLCNLAMRYMHPLFLNKSFGPMNRVRTKYGLNRFSNIFEMYSSGDYVGYLDPEGIIDHDPLPPEQCFLGPIMYSAPTPVPPWRESFIKNPINILVSMGSSGATENISKVISALKELPVQAAVATADRLHIADAGKNIYTTSLLDLADLLPYTKIVIGNGGCPVNYLSLSHAVPVIGLPFNLDQYLNMQIIENQGAGIMLRTGTLTARDIKASVEKILKEDSYRIEAQKVKNIILKKNPYKEFSQLLSRAAKFKSLTAI